MGVEYFVSGSRKLSDTGTIIYLNFFGQCLCVYMSTYNFMVKGKSFNRLHKVIHGLP